MPSVSQAPCTGHADTGRAWSLISSESTAIPHGAISLLTASSSVERVVEYLDLPQEPPAIIEDNRPPAYWPSTTTNGDLISVENLVIKYAPDLPAVLQDVSFTLQAGERIGLLGRTGSGKSTLAMSILRFVDPSSGRILIDGIDISKIGIHDLRERLVGVFLGARSIAVADRNVDVYSTRCHPVFWHAAREFGSFRYAVSRSRIFWY